LHTAEKESFPAIIEQMKAFNTSNRTKADDICEISLSGKVWIDSTAKGVSKGIALEFLQVFSPP
jgi:hydroxymethylpyrimidine pyrophosphatase-like HAD family hydrolase